MQDRSQRQSVPCAGKTLQDFNAFYGQMQCAEGIPVLASAKVSPSALTEVERRVAAMLAKAPDIATSLSEGGAFIGVIGQYEGTTDLPEYAFLRDDPTMDWNARTRGFGATQRVPLMSAGEENLLCLATDRYRPEDIFVHEFAHSIVNFLSPEKRTKLKADIQRAYSAAMDNALYAQTYAATNTEEYFAEGVQSFFNVNAEAIPANGIHNHVNTRQELLDYDPELYGIILALFGNVGNLPSCYSLL